jgi:hypothetical protein
MTMYEGGIEVMDPTVKANLTTVDCLIQADLNTSFDIVRYHKKMEHYERQIC